MNIFKPYEYKLNNSQYFIELEGVDRWNVNTGRFRPDKYFPSSSMSVGKPIAVTKVSEFVLDLFFQTGFLKYAIEDYGQDISGSVIRSALITACENHIAKHGRLIDTDLYTYVDVNFHIISSITSKPDIEIKEMYDGVVREMTGIFRDSIYVSDPIRGLRKLV